MKRAALFKRGKTCKAVRTGRKNTKRMKKLLFVPVCLLVIGNALAQDIITTVDAQQIRAKITEVSKDAVKYHEFDNPDGRTYVLRKEDISAIQYQNGKMVTYQAVEEEETAEETKDEAGNRWIIRDGNTYYYDGMPMKKDVYESFLLEHCPGAYNHYYSGRKLARSGWGLFGGAVGAAAVVGLLQGFIPNNNGVIVACWAIPDLMLVASIPVLCVGYSRMHRSADTFNTMCADKQPQAYWSINASQNGIGLALNF